MYPWNGNDPGRFIADFVTSFTEELLRSDDDPALIVDRYHTPDIVQIADGIRIDRDGLIAHANPVRRNRPSARVEVHEALASGDRIATRYTLHVRNRKGDLAIEVHFFGQFAPDGRMRRAHMLTRTLPADASTGEPTPATPERQEARAKPGLATRGPW